jgi:molybdenum cofactor guanylyltransferase
MSTSQAARQSVTALILAGGRGSRLGGQDKGLLTLRGRPLVERILAAIEPQVDAVLINANRNRDRYQRYGHPVISDPLEGFQGPLAGLAAGLAAAFTPLVVTLPCDCPRVPRDLVGRLRRAYRERAADVAMVHDGQRAQPVYALLGRDLLASLEAFLAAGERKLMGWYGQHPVVFADFSDCADIFVNVNTPEDMAHLERSQSRALGDGPARGPGPA